MSPALTLLLATGAGLGVASIYYSQPILGLLGAEMQATDRMRIVKILSDAIAPLSTQALPAGKSGKRVVSFPSAKTCCRKLLSRRLAFPPSRKLC